MKKTHRSVTLIALVLVLTLFSCAKEEGPGGTSTITGKVVVRQYNDNFTSLMEPPYYAPDEDVFIIYGDDPVYGDKTTTGYDGTYLFEYLREGTYIVYAYSEDSANYPTQHEIAVMKQVSITNKNQVVTVPNIIILK